MNKKATQTAEELTTSINLNADDVLVFQDVPNKILALMASGTIDVTAMAREELIARGLDRQGQDIGLREERALFETQGDQLDIDTFADQEMVRILAFRKRWHEANKINPIIFPRALPRDNEGLWSEQLQNFDLDRPFDLPDEPKLESQKTKGRRP